eukprot:jgi/Chrzof1/10379/Cz04g39220.t1
MGLTNTVSGWFKLFGVTAFLLVLASLDPWLLGISKMGEGRIDTEVVIPASPEKVWEVFADFDSWKDWSDFMVYTTPPTQVGKKCSVTFKLDAGPIRRSTHKPVVRFS